MQSLCKFALLPHLGTTALKHFTYSLPSIDCPMSLQRARFSSNLHRLHKSAQFFISLIFLFLQPNPPIIDFPFPLRRLWVLFFFFCIIFQRKSLWIISPRKKKKVSLGSLKSARKFIYIYIYHLYARKKRLIISHPSYKFPFKIFSN